MRNPQSNRLAGAASPWVVQCLDACGSSDGRAALDLACGNGRNTLELVRRGYSVTCADINAACLLQLRLSVTRCPGLQSPADVACLILDANRRVVVCDEAFDMVVVVHFTRPGLIAETARLLRPHGTLIFETFGAHGNNWLQLPKRTELEEELILAGFEPLQTRYRTANFKNGVVTAKIMARKVLP